MNPTLETMKAHRTIRRYRATPIADEVVADAVRAAQQAPTSSNVQAYALVRVRDAARRAELAELCSGQAQVRDAAAFFVVCGDQRRHRLAARTSGRPYEPNLETFLLAVIDASLFAQNLVLAFESQGYGTCYIGALRNRVPEVDRLLSLPADVFPLYGLCVGTPDEEPAVRPRLPLEAVLLEERYPDDESMLSRIATYDETMSAYYAAARGKPGHDWSGGVARKFAERNRECLLDFYTAKGAVFE